MCVCVCVCIVPVANLFSQPSFVAEMPCSRAWASAFLLYAFSPWASLSAIASLGSRIFSRPRVACGMVLRSRSLLGLGLGLGFGFGFGFGFGVRVRVRFSHERACVLASSNVIAVACSMPEPLSGVRACASTSLTILCFVPSGDDTTVSSISCW